MLVIDAFGCFKSGSYSMVPYQHHSSRHTWKVAITFKDFKEDTVDFELDTTTVFAKTALEAAQRGKEFFERALIHKENLKQWERQQQEEKIKKQLKQRTVKHGSEQSDAPSGA